MEIFKNFKGCDFVLNLGIERKNTRIKLLQLTDMQFIDSSQMRSPDRLRKDEIIAWKPENFNSQCANQIRSLIAQSNPDLIFRFFLIIGVSINKGTVLTVPHLLVLIFGRVKTLPYV